jgi:ELP3 family radical SAM enzyme/protein acetyltransferase
MERIQDIEDHCKRLPQEFQFKNLDDLPPELIEKHTLILQEIQIRLPNVDRSSMRDLYRQYKAVPSNAALTQIYLKHLDNGTMSPNPQLEAFLTSKKCRRVSGVTVVTVFLSPYPNGQSFSCQWDCAYCPKEPGQPRSYLFAEPGVLRANQNGFDCVKQMLSRLHTYRLLGHPTDKLEVLILGGTIYSYPKSYLETYFRDIFYAANVCFDPIDTRRLPLSLEEEQRINETTKHRIIGITVETRPDCIKPTELHDFRQWGVTRVQLGVQHTNDAILKKINRKSTHADTMAAVSLLRDNGFKFDIHLMPNLPGTTPELDMHMMDVVLKDIQPDQVKVYPTETTPFTKILQDYKKGLYVPYGNDDLERVVIYWKIRVHPWIRNNRIIRDIPSDYIVAGVKSGNQRQEFQEIMKQLGRTCKCIRCREAGRHSLSPQDGELVIRNYWASGGMEFFISWESKPEHPQPDDAYNAPGYEEYRRSLFGFVRLRLHENANNIIFPELMDSSKKCAALVRELHVYGDTTTVGAQGRDVQHLGIGKKLMAKAERIALDHGYTKIAVISGNSVRQYYHSIGYQLEGTFMTKRLCPRNEELWFIVALLIASCIAILLLE